MNSYGNITVANNSLLEKHEISVQEFDGFMETCEIQYALNSNASQFRGASLCERKMLSENWQKKTDPDVSFVDKYGKPWRHFRADLLDKMNRYALEFYNFRKPLGSPNGKNFW